MKQNQDKQKSAVRDIAPNNSLNAAIEEIVNRLFENGSGEKARRLVLELENGRDGGGWCKDAVRDQIRDVLQLESA
jgi:hypothetical protein